MKKTFTEKVREVVKKIPKGKVLTYKQVATRAGNPNGARAVGVIMSRNFDTSIPCHRVVRLDGKKSGYNRGGWEKKKQILTEEGYKFLLNSFYKTRPS